MLLQLPSICVPDTITKEHGDGSHVKDANVPDERVVGEPLAVHPVAHLTGHDSESAMPTIAAPDMLSTCTLVTKAVMYRNESHVKVARLPSEHAAVELLAVHPAARFTVHDSESPMLTSRCRKRCQHAHWPQTAW